MATAVLKNGNGKRERNQMDPEDAEFMPLSKRINNLHLRPSHHHPHQQQQQNEIHGHPLASSSHHPHQQQQEASNTLHLNGGIENNSNHAIGTTSPFNSNISQPGHEGRSHQQQQYHQRELSSHDSTVQNFHAHHHHQSASMHSVSHQPDVRNSSSNSSNTDRNSNIGPHINGSTVDNFDATKIHNHNNTIHHPQQHHHSNPNPNNMINYNMNVIEGHNYNPVLDATSNPHYYESNRQLYLLYLERMQRHGQPLHDHFFSP